MPLLLLVVAGLVLVFATSYVTLGWILVAVGAVVFLIWVVGALLIANAVRKQHKQFNREFNKSWNRF